MALPKSAAISLNKATEAAAVDDDAALVSRAQSGDHSAFDTLMIKYRERIYGVVYNMTANRDDAADITQDAFIKAFSSIQRFQGKSSFFTWLYRIAVNTALSHIKKNRKRRFFSFENLHEDAGYETAVEVLSAKTKTDKNVLLGELQEKLNEALQKLSPKHRTVVVLYEIDGLSHAEIADIVGCSQGTVRSRLHYAKQQLQSYLEEYLR